MADEDVEAIKPVTLSYEYLDNGLTIEQTEDVRQIVDFDYLIKTNLKWKRYFMNFGIADVKIINKHRKKLVSTVI